MTTSEFMKWTGSSRRNPTDTHLFQVGDRWYESEDAYKKYRHHENKRKRFRASGFPYTEKGWVDFARAEGEEKRQHRIKKETEAKARAERDKIRDEFNLSKYSRVVTRQSARGKQAMIEHVRRENLVRMDSEQRLALIKELYDDKTVSLRDILIRTCQIVGADIETLKRAN